MIGPNNESSRLIVRPREAEIARLSMVPALRQSAASQPGQNFDFRPILGAFRRRWFLALFLGISGGLLAAAGAYTLIPAPYTAIAELRISSVRDVLLFKTSEERAQFDVYKQTQTKLIKSPYVLNAALRADGISKLKTVRNEEYALQWLTQELRVANEGAEFVKVSLSGDAPQDLAAIVNAVADAYLVEVVGEAERKRNERISNLEKVQHDVQEQLRTKRRQMKDIATNLQAGNLEQANSRKQYLLELAIQMRKELAEVHLQLMNAGVSLNLDADEPKPPEASPNADAHSNPAPEVAVPQELVEAQLDLDARIRDSLTRVAAQEAFVARSEKQLPANHPRLLEARQNLVEYRSQADQVRNQVRPEIERAVRAQIVGQNAAQEAQEKRQVEHLAARAKLLNAELAKVKTEEKATGNLSFEFDEVEQQIAQSEKIAERVAEEIERVRIEMGTPVGVSVHAKAEVPVEPSTKTRLAGTGLAGLGVFAFFVGGIVWLEVLARRINSMDELFEHLHVRVMGTLPNMPRSVTRRSSRHKENSRTAFWNSVLTESIDSTRTMLFRDARMDSIQVVMLTSAMAGEGKTTCSCHLASSIARARRRVILVDFDLRRPNAHRVFGEALTPGVSEVLRGEATLDEAIRSIEADGSFLLPAGKVSPAVLQKLAEDGAAGLLAELRTRFDFVLVDSAPVLPVTDSLLVAQHVDGVILSIRRDVSRQSKVVGACQRLAMLGIPLLGAVAIGLDEGSYGYRYTTHRPGFGPGETGRSAPTPENVATTVS